MGARVLATDDADSLKTVAEDLEVDQQFFHAHVNWNVHDLIAAIHTKALEHPDPILWELKPAHVSVDQFIENLQTAETVIAELPADGCHFPGSG